MARAESVLYAMKNLALTGELGSNLGKLLTMNVVLMKSYMQFTFYWRGNHKLGLFFFFGLLR